LITFFNKNQIELKLITSYYFTIIWDVPICFFVHSYNYYTTTL
jgi:hypothetical protein